MKFFITFLLFIKLVNTGDSFSGIQWNSILKSRHYVSKNGNLPFRQTNDSKKPLSFKDLAPIVYTKSGAVQGIKNKTEGIKTVFYLYMGIPYAEPPLGSLRFKPPVPVKPWQHLLLAFKEGNICTQKISLQKDTILGHENCLFLNIYTPEIKNQSHKLPVMFWIYGGGYYMGSGNRDVYGPDYLIEKNVIVVTHNYRLGPLGFLSLNTSDAPGNIGIKDSLLALKWIHDNIENFGGDPDKITIFGESAGGVTVHLLILSQLSKGLFRAAILESGVAITRWALSFDHVKLAKHLAKSLGIKDEDPPTIISKLQQKSAEDIFSKSYSTSFFVKAGVNPMNYFPWNPCVEYKHSDAIISDLPYTIMMSNLFNHVPMILGYNSREGLMWLSVANNKGLRITATEMYGYISPGLAVNLNKATKKEVNKLIKKRYYPKTRIPDNDTFINLITVTDFINPIHQSAWLISNNSNENIYLYKFGYQGNISVRAVMNLDKLGIEGDPHAEELGYIWYPYAIERYLNDRDKQARENIVTLFTNFAKHLNPNPLPSSKGIWKPLGTEHNYLNFSDDLIPDVKPDWDDIEFWNGLYDKYGKPPYLNY